MNLPCLEFINSQWHDKRHAFSDPLLEQDWLAAFCQRWELPFPADASDRLMRLRSLLSQAAHEFCASGTLACATLDELNAYLRPVTLHIELAPQTDAFGSLLRERLAGEAVNVFACELVRSLARLIGGPGGRKLKCCSNPDCGWFYYDSSRNGTRKWCDNTCASLIKVRKFREAGKRSGQ